MFKCHKTKLLFRKTRLSIVETCTLRVTASSAHSRTDIYAEIIVTYLASGSDV